MRLLKEKIRSISTWCAKHKAIAAGLMAVSTVVFSAITYYSIEATSTIAFCTSCHEMKPEYESYMQSSHYKVKDLSRRAVCRDCHVPPWTHPISLLWTKTYHGIKDVTKHFLDSRDFMTPGYHERMAAEAPHGVHNASCMKCHEDILEPEVKNGKANIHALMRKNHNSRCTDCHRNIVHYPMTLVRQDR